jgi:hypothetical protein
MLNLIEYPILCRQPAGVTIPCLGRESLRRRTGILAIPDFRRFYAGYVTSLLGSSMSTVAIAWAVLDNGGARPARREPRRREQRRPGAGACGMT